MDKTVCIIKPTFYDWRYKLRNLALIKHPRDQSNNWKQPLQNAISRIKNIRLEKWNSAISAKWIIVASQLTQHAQLNLVKSIVVQNTRVVAVSFFVQNLTSLLWWNSQIEWIYLALRRWRHEENWMWPKIFKGMENKTLYRT